MTSLVGNLTKNVGTKKLVQRSLAVDSWKPYIPDIIDFCPNITATLEISGASVSKNEYNFENFQKNRQGF